MGYISWCHHWFHRKMMSVKRVQKFRTYDMSIPRSGSAFWLVEANFQPIRPTTQIWVVKGHQYGIFVLISQTSFCRETSCGEMAKWWLFSQAVIRKGGNDYMNVFLTVCITSILPLYSGTLPYGYLSNTVTSLLWPLFWGGYTFPWPMATFWNPKQMESLIISPR